MSEHGKAVFLSYASQDAEAAKRIADALRSAGVEVWFDAEGGLEHGDEWDQKIRRQIKECVLFLPIISANTQAREEGYFRIEWELAAQRALGIASGVAFILPIVIDDTREPDALVPDRFRTVQWTRLRGGELTPEVKARFLKLWSHRTGALKHEAAVGRDHRIPPGSDKAGFGDPALQSKLGWKIYAGLAVAVFALAAGAAWWMLRPGSAPVPVAAPAPIGSPARPTREWPKDPELKKAFAIITGLDATIESCRLAEDMVNAVLKQRPTDPEATTVYAMLNNYYINRGYDASEERQVLARRFSERALQLAPAEPEAQAAMAQYLSFRGADYARAETLIRKAMALEPQDPRFARILAYSVLRPTDPLRALAQAKENAALFPQDPLTQYDLALICRGTGDLALMEEAIDRTLALTPLPSALIWKGWLAAWMHGDLPGFKRWLDRISGNFRFNERAVYMHYLYACLSGDTAHGLEALRAFPGSWMNDFYYTGPRSLLSADLLALAGKPELARVEYGRALAEIGRMAERDSQGTVWRAEFWALRGTGREADARAAAKRMMQRQNRPYRPLIMQWWHDVIPAQLLAGDRADALALIREAVVAPAVRAQIRTSLKIDHRMTPFRDDPEIQALLAEPEQKTQTMFPETGSSTSIDQKSVAVLAFANLSDDKANEYFSDGISEELLNVLAKVPGLKVSARTSAFYFKGKEVPVPEIAKQLGVAYVVEGSVRKQGDKVRITAQLIKAADGFHVWSDTFTRDLKDIFALQDEIAGLIAQKLQLKLGVAAVAERPVDAEAYRLVLLGRNLVQRSNAKDDLIKARQYLEEALARDPKFGLAWAWLSITHWSEAANGWAPVTRGYAAAREAAERALALAPDLSDAYSAIGLVYYGSDWDWRRAQDAFERALALAPGNASIVGNLARTATTMGDNDKAVRLGRQAVELDPLNAYAQYTLCMALFQAGRFEEMGRQVTQLVQLNRPGTKQEVFALLMLKRNEEALRVAEQAEGHNRTFLLALTNWAAGHKSEADKYLARLKSEAPDSAAYQVAELYAWRGVVDEAFEWLETSYRQRDAGMIWLKNDPLLSGLRGDPRWEPLLRKMGLADDQLK